MEHKHDQHLLDEIDMLRKENNYLKHIIQQHNLPLRKATPITKYATTHEKIQLFMQLFRGRTDVYATRYTSKSGRSGYVPACANEWVKNICIKPEKTCKDCSCRSFLPLNQQTIEQHLLGTHIVGIYPLNLDFTCHFVAMDFDKHQWQSDSLAVTSICSQYEVPFALERSRSGHGAHVWIFFSEKIDAALARTFAYRILELASNENQNLELQSYDRIFPTQSTLHQNGLGNLIALPLQKNSRTEGNSCFVNDSFEAYEDQWAFLSGMKRINKDRITQFLTVKTKTISAEPQVVVPGPILISLFTGVKLKTHFFTTSQIEHLKKIASVSNPKFFALKAARMKNHLVPQAFTAYIEHEGHLILPRGCLEPLKQCLQDWNLQFEIQDIKVLGIEITVEFLGELRIQQQEAVNEILLHTDGVLVAPTGFGKTVCAAAIIAELKKSTLIIVPNTALLEQWSEKLKAFLGNATIGVYSGIKKAQSKCIDIATIQTLVRMPNIESFLAQYGTILIDECHHMAARSFEKVLVACPSKRVYGMTASPTRKDGLHKLGFLYCGPIRHTVKQKEHQHITGIITELIEKKTAFKSTETQLPSIYAHLSRDETRNTQIFNDVLNALDHKRYPLLLTQRTEHIDLLHQLFRGFVKNIIVLSGALSKKERTGQLEKLHLLQPTDERIVIATGQYLGEGFDYDYFDTLFLVMPISWKGTLQQYVGRLQRGHADKQLVQVYDYHDEQVPVLTKMYNKRLSGYRNLGYNERDAWTETQLRLL
ncbi:MAG: TOTE conflict system archaeo-eukaryotic primase domain-containing protein [Bacilli bacterium]